MSGYRLLVADDDEAARTGLAGYLSLAGYQVIQAADGREAVETARLLRPDLVLLDIQMPGSDGLEALASLREDETFADVPILLTTSLSRTNLKVKALDLGADDYIVKPFDRTELVARVRRALRRSARFKRLSSTLAGDLSSVSLPELLQTLDLSRRTARIGLPELGAELVLEKGRLESVRLGSHEGLEALCRLLLSPRGPFRVAFEESRPAPVGLPDSPSILEALLECTRRLDEVQSALPQPLTWETVVAVEESADPLLLAGSGAGLLTAGEIVARADADLHTASRTLADAIRTGTVRPVAPAA